MRKSWFLLLVVIGLFSIIASQSNAGDDFSVTVSSKVWSEYVGAMGVVVHNKPVLQTDLCLSLPKGFYFDIWHSAGLDDDDLSSNFGDEIDLTGGWTGEIGKNFYLNVGLIYYDIYPLLEGDQLDAFVPFIEAGRNFEVGSHTIVPFGRLEVNLLTGDTNSGVYLFAGVKHVWKLPADFSIRQKADLFYDSGGFGMIPGLLGRYEGELSWQVSGIISLEPISVRVRTPLDSIPDRETEAAFGAGATLYF